jgi:type VI secretion system secreted protein VgrG
VASDHAQSRLVLGYNTRIVAGAGRQQARGEGVELATNAVAVFRANQGMLLSTEARDGATAPAKDMGETVQRLTQARDIHENLAGLAKQHEAQEEDTNQRDVTQVIKTQNDAIRGGVASPDSPFPQLSRPDMVLASAAGFGFTAAESTHIASVEHTALTAGGHVSIAAGKSLLASVVNGVRVFVHKLGIKLIAASGKVRIEAQNDNVELVARRAVELMSTTDWINLTAKQGVRINGGGSELVISRAGIAGYTDGQFLVHAGDHQGMGPMTKPIVFPGRPDDFCERCFAMAAKSGSAIVPQ